MYLFWGSSNWNCQGIFWAIFRSRNSSLFYVVLKYFNAITCNKLSQKMSSNISVLPQKAQEHCHCVIFMWIILSYNIFGFILFFIENRLFSQTIYPDYGFPSVYSVLHLPSHLYPLPFCLSLGKKQAFKRYQ